MISRKGDWLEKESIDPHSLGAELCHLTSCFTMRTLLKNVTCREERELYQSLDEQAMESSLPPQSTWS
jgi:hypothetical protein